MLVLMLAGLLTGCATAPVYDSIRGVTVHHQQKGGTTRVSFEGDKLAKAKACLANTVEISQEESSSDFLQSIYLIEVSDRSGDRMFELYTAENFKGNKGKYYKNSCIYPLIIK